MATEDLSNTSRPPQLTPAELSTLAGRLIDHADGIENITCAPLVADLRLASRAIEQLRGTPDALAKGLPEPVTVTSLKALLNRLLDHGQATGDDALYRDIETAGRLIFTLWEVIEQAGIRHPHIEFKAGGAC
jgi:hypothetical protein